MELELVNLDLAAGRAVVVQVGSFGEHQFVEASAAGCDLVAVDGRWLEDWDPIIRPRAARTP